MPKTVKAMTLQQFWQATAHQEQGLFPVTGDCMERMDIYDGDYIRVDFTKMPLPPRYGPEPFHDAVLCLYQPDKRSAPIIAVKAYDGMFGWMQRVGTMYDRKKHDMPFDYGYEPLAIFGTVEAVYDADMNLRWERDLFDRPKALGTEPTIKCQGFTLGKVARV